MDEESRKKIFREAAGCMDNLVSSSGHLTSYSLDWESFEISGVEPYGNDLTEFSFSANATAQGEFMSGPQDPEDWEPATGEDAGPGGMDPDMMEMSGIEPVMVDPMGEELVPVSSSIVLDAQLRLALDENGNARLKGYACLPPAHWHPEFMGK